MASKRQPQSRCQEREGQRKWGKGLTTHRGSNGQSVAWGPKQTISKTQSQFMAHSILQMLQMDLTHMTRCQCHSATQEALSAEEPEPFLKDGGNTAQDCLKCFRRTSPSTIHTFLLTHRHLIISSPELGSPLPILTSMLLSSSSPQEIPHQPPRPEIWVSLGFPGGSDGKESAWNAGDLDLTPGSRRSLGEGHGNPL